MLAAVPDLPAVEAPTTQPAVTAAGPGETLVVLVIVAGAATALAWWAGAFRRGVDGPRRVDEGFAWLPAAAFAAALLGVVLASAGLAVAGVLDPDAGDPPLADLLVANAAVYLAAAAGAVLTTALVTRLVGRGVRLGLDLRGLPPSAGFALAATVIILPWMLAAGVVLQLARSALGLETQQAHQLLRELADATGGTLALIVVTAVVVAPVCEEILFRGVLQTALAAGLGRLLPRPPVPPPQPAPASGDVLDSLTAAPDDPRGPRPPARWAAIALTSLGFAALHEAWSIPLIFLLSLALGYCYERTGRLWVPIGIHFAFNAFNTLLAHAYGTGPPG